MACGLLAASPAIASDEAGLYWIWWGPRWEEAARTEARTSPPALSERAQRRLARAGKAGPDDPANRPAPAGFLEMLQSRGVEIRTASRLLRAVSAPLTEAQRALLAADPDVAELRPVARWTAFPPEPPGPASHPPADAAPGARPAGPQSRWEGRGGAGAGAGSDTLPDPRLLTRADYGPAYRQCEQLGITALHRLGYSGRGVVLCMLDGGFFRGHEVFDRTDVVAAIDFVEGDTTVGFDPTRPQGGYNTRAMNAHGTYTWSTLGGFRAGRHVGPAYRASFALGRTEIVEAEIRLEEDRYVAGLEWADGLGADIVSTSLGYLSFPAQGFAYSYEELDGRTAVTTRAAARLTERGVLLVTAMGNEGPDPGTLITPADAESVCSVGAVDAAGRIFVRSSRGPNARGVVKPDLCARGVTTACASAGPSADVDTAYAAVNGTSLATPLIAGLAALLLEAHPEWSGRPMELLRALRAAGDRAGAPQNIYGYGIPDGLAALGALGPQDPEASLLAVAAAAAGWEESESGSDEDLRDFIPNPGEAGTLRLSLRNPGPFPSRPAWASLVAPPEGITLVGDSVRVEALGPGEAVALPAPLRVRIAEEQAAPASIPLSLRLRTEAGQVYYLAFVLEVFPPVWQTHAYPNPVRPGESVRLDLDLPRAGPVAWRLIDVTGRQRAGPWAAQAATRQARILWTLDRSIPSGVYWLRIEAPGAVQVRTLTVVSR